MDFLWLRIEEMKIRGRGRGVFLAILQHYVMLCLPNNSDLCKHISQGRYIPCVSIYTCIKVCVTLNEIEVVNSFAVLMDYFKVV